MKAVLSLERKRVVRERRSEAKKASRLLVERICCVA